MKEHLYLCSGTAEDMRWRDGKLYPFHFSVEKMIWAKNKGKALEIFDEVCLREGKDIVSDLKCERF